PLDAPVPDCERQPLEIAHAAGREGGQRQGLLQLEALVADDLEGQPQPLCHLLLIAGRWRGEAEHGGTDLAEAGLEVAEALRLRGRAVGAGDVVPAGRVGATSPAPTARPRKRRAS